MIPRLILAFSVVLLTLAGCDTQGPLTQPEPEPLLPLEVGNAWVLQRARTDGFPVPDRGPDTLSVLRSEVRDGTEWFLLGSSYGSLDGCMGGNYALINGDVWFTPDLDGIAPYLVYATADSSYTVSGRTTDATVTAETIEPGLFRYSYDYQRFRIGSGEYPVVENAPESMREMERGVGFRFFDNPYFSFANGGTEEMERAANDRWSLVAFLPAEE